MGAKRFFEGRSRLSREDQAEFDRINTEYNSRVTIFLSAVSASLLSASMTVGYISYTSGAEGVEEFWLVLPYHVACIALSLAIFFMMLVVRKKHIQRCFLSELVSVVQIAIIMILFLISSHVEIPVTGIKNINVLIIAIFAVGFFLRFRIGVTLGLVAFYVSAVVALLFTEKQDISNFYPSLINMICSFVVASFAAFLYWDSRKNQFISTKRLELLATSDSLTRLHNRRSFDVYIEQEWRRAANEKLYLILFFIDVDSFKNYNDLYGHVEGDRCLSSVADAISASVRKNDFAARYGGEEFVVTMTGDNAGMAERVGRHMLEAMRGLNIPHGDSVAPYVTLSIGCMIRRPDEPGELSLSEFIEKADAALYMAKEQGRDRFVIHPDALALRN